MVPVLFKQNLICGIGRTKSYEIDTQIGSFFPIVSREEKSDTRAQGVARDCESCDVAVAVEGEGVVDLRRRDGREGGMVC
jgi:hypothetical protein